MRILIAPNAFKGSLSVLEAAAAMRKGARSVFPGARMDLMPISDGGDGLIDALLCARGGRKITVSVKGPLGEPRRAQFALLKDGTAVVEMARASGLGLIAPAKRDPLNATSYGTGQLIAAALAAGARNLVVGMGGSATNDGGAGMAQALGARLLDEAGRDLPAGARALLRLSRVESSALRGRLKGIRVIAVSDVTNPLLGAKGSARVYGPQKGATPAMVKTLEKALRRYAAVLKRDLGADVGRRAGAGAAGGLGAGLIAFLNAEIVPGAAWVLKEAGAARRLAEADAALTGEGRIDKTSFCGKAPIELARLSRSRGVPAAAVCASLDESVRARLKSSGLGAVKTLPEAGASARTSYTQAPRWTSKAAALALRSLLLASIFLTLQPSAHAAPADFNEIDDLYFHRDKAGNLEQSQRKLDALLAAEPRNADILWRKGRGLVRLGERQEKKRDKLDVYTRAQDTLQEAVKNGPNNAEAHFWLGIAMGRYGETKGVLKSLFLISPIRKEMRATLSLDPKHGGAHHVLGKILMEVPGFAGGSKKGAVAEFEESVRLSPRHSVNYVALAEAYSAVGDDDKAAETLHKLLQLKDPDDPAEFPDDVKDGQALLKKLGR